MYPDPNIYFSDCSALLVTRFRETSQLRFCYGCENHLQCPANIFPLRIVLVVLKNLIHFRNCCNMDRCLEAVLGPEITQAFHQRFCVPSKNGDGGGFGNPGYTCGRLIPRQIMPRLALSANLKFNFSYKDLFGETLLECCDRMRESEPSE